MELVDNITLIGMPGAGKSTVGVLLAKTLGYGFIDTDLVLQQQKGEVLQTLVDRLGQEGFYACEEAAICTLNCHQTVIAPGGSAVCEPRAMARLKELGPVVYLEVPAEELERRIGNIRTRGIVMAPGQTLADLLAQRAPLYQRYADITVPVSGQTLEESVAAVLRALLNGQARE